ncbi:MAG: hypothetical protein JWO22_2851 [Frankiales bacterium]|nr:hypothetical protein [Frankiales bacterium]
MRPLFTVPALALALSACAGQPAQLVGAQPTVPPDLAGHQYDRPHADQVLVAGDTATISTATGTFRVTVNGPALKALTSFTKLPVGALHHYLATFTVTVTSVRGSQQLSPGAFRLLAIADQDAGGAVKTTVAQATTLVTTTLTGGTWTGTWSAPFVEGHGELLLTPAGAARPAALWDFRAES